MSLSAAVAFVLAQETGATVSGGAGAGWVSKWGIDSRFHPELTLDQVRNLTEERAAIILGGPQYWDAVHGSELPDWLQLPMLDAGVNEGPAAAIKCLQRALYITVDGAFGPVTAKAVAAANPTTTLALFTAQRILAYTQDRTWVQDGEGWTKRAVLAALSAV